MFMYNFWSPTNLRISCVPQLASEDLEQLEISQDRLESKPCPYTCVSTLGAALSCLLTTRRARFSKHVRNALGLNSVSKIDRLSRFLFPVSFLALNILYWVAYLDLGRHAS